MRYECAGKAGRVTLLLALAAEVQAAGGVLFGQRFPAAEQSSARLLLLTAALPGGPPL